MKRRLLYSAIMAAAFLPVLAQNEAADSQPVILNLDECRALAVGNNAKVKVAAGNAEAAEQVRKEAFTKYFPTVEATGTAFQTSRPVINYDLFDFATLKMIKGGIGAGITAVQPVFAGGRIVNGNRLASVGAEVGRLEHEGAIDDVLLTVEEYYWKLATLKSQKLTLESVIQMVDTLERQVNVAVEAGVAMRNDLLKVQLQQNDLKATMVDLDNGIILCRQLLAQYIGRDGEAIDIPAELTPDEMPMFPSDIYIEPSDALASTVDYRLLDQKVKAAELERRIALGNNLPTVGVGAGYFYDRVIGQNNHFGAVFVSVSIPISGWWGGSHAVKKSKIAAANAVTERDDLSQMLKIKMTDTWDNLTAAYRKMEIAKESIAQSTENLRLNRNYYEAGISTITELLDAQTLYRQSLDNYTQAYGNFRTARAAYLNATGR